MKKQICIILVGIELLSCTTTKQFDQKMIEKNCEEALEQIPENQSDVKLAKKIQQVSGTVLSYSVTGGAYTVQVLWDIAATVAAVAILCAPTITVLVLAKGNPGPLHPYCFDGNITKVQAPKWGKEMFNKTRNWRCPEVDGISRSIRQVAQCYQNRGDDMSRKKALVSLQSIANSETFYQCLSKSELSLFEKDLASAKF